MKKSNSKLMFNKKEFSFSFKSFTINLSGEKPVSNIITLIEKNLISLKAKIRK